MKKETNFDFVIPLDFYKGDNDEWKIRGVASTEDMDLQGEIVRQNNLDITPLKEGRGLFNWDHQQGPENIVGVVEDAEITDKGLTVEGYLLKNSTKAKEICNILSSFKNNHKKRLQMSIEGKILRRAGGNGKEIASARVDKVALTFDPVNPHTYAEFVKSLSSAQSEIESDPVKDQETFTADQVLDIISKSLQKVSNGDKLSYDCISQMLSELIVKASSSYNFSNQDYFEIDDVMPLADKIIRKAQTYSLMKVAQQTVDLWEEVGTFGDLNDTDMVLSVFKSAIANNDSVKVREMIPNILRIWNEDGIGLDYETTNKAHEVYENLSKLIGLYKALSAGNYNAKPSNLQGGTALQKESLDRKKKKKD